MPTEDTPPSKQVLRELEKSETYVGGTFVPTPHPKAMELAATQAAAAAAASRVRRHAFGWDRRAGDILRPLFVLEAPPADPPSPRFLRVPQDDLSAAIALLPMLYFFGHGSELAAPTSSRFSRGCLEGEPARWYVQPAVERYRWDYRDLFGTLGAAAAPSFDRAQQSRAVAGARQRASFVVSRAGHPAWAWRSAVIAQAFEAYGVACDYYAAMVTVRSRGADFVAFITDVAADERTAIGQPPVRRQRALLEGPSSSLQDQREAAQPREVRAGPSSESSDSDCDAPHAGAAREPHRRGNRS